MDKIIFCLTLNSNESILAIEKPDYSTNYYDSELYCKFDNHTYKIYDGAFVEGFGLQMYYRMYNVNSYCDSNSFTKKLINDSEKFISAIMKDRASGTNIEQDKYFADGKDVQKQYFFTGGYNDLWLYLYKKEDSYVLMFLKWYEIENTGKFFAEIYNEFTLNEDTFMEWKKTITDAWEARAREFYDGYDTEEEWNKFFSYMRND